MYRDYEICDESIFEAGVVTRRSLDRRGAVSGYVKDSYGDDWSDTVTLYVREVGSATVYRAEVSITQTIDVSVVDMREVNASPDGSQP